MTLPYQTVALDTLLGWLEDGAELAFIDAREEGLYGEGHPLLAVNTPYSVLEQALPARVPRASTRVVLYAENPEQGSLAATRLSELGYSALHLLEGGIQAWQAAGLALFKGVNVPSKAFAECVEHSLHTPAIDAQALNTLIQSQADYVLLDSRTVEEYERFHVPTAVSVPSAELLYRFDDLVPSPDTLVVVTCAGRTRGIIGAQTLINAGVPNKVVALAGGTQGWRLAGLRTVTDSQRYFAPLSDAARASARARALKLAERFGVAWIDAATLRDWQSDPQRTTYLFDVRNVEEYAASHHPGARWAPGGQLVQALDQWVATRNARIVLNDLDGVRATTTAHWLRQLGWDAVVLAGFDPAAASAVGLAAPTALPAIDPLTAKRLLDAGAIALSAQRSADYRRAHLAGARWVNRARLAPLLPVLAQASELLVFAEQPALANGVAYDLRKAGLAATVVLGDAQQWQAAGLELHTSPGIPEDAQRIDYLFWLHDRHDGNLASSAAYISWEEDLPRQVGEHSNARFDIRP